jgi:hypothetical protein
MTKLILFILLISNIAYAQESVYLNAKDPAPFAGYLLPEEEVKTLRDNTLELDMYKTTNDLKDQQITLLTNQNTSLSKTLESTSSLSTWEKIGYFAAGVLLTGLAVDAASKIISH